MLDIGCGEGIFAYILFKDKIDVGIDPQATELAHAKELNIYSELLQCFGDKIPKDSKSFSTILSNSVLEHIPNVKPVLIEAHRLLKDDGDFYITVPTDYFDQYSVVCQVLQNIGLTNLANKYRSFFNNFWAHYHYFDISGWTNLLSECGFKVVESKQYCTKTQGVTNDLLAPFSLLAFVQKKFFNKWFVFKKLRVFNAFILSIIFNKMSQNDDKVTNGGIVFFHLKKQ